MIMSEDCDSQDYEAVVTNIADEDVLCVAIPYKGCTVIPPCLFCGVRERANKALEIDAGFGEEVLRRFKLFIEEYGPDSVAYYSGGNVLRPEEMHQPTVLEDIPKYIAGRSDCMSYEIEVRVDDVLKYLDSLKIIITNLGGKNLIVRLGVEFFDDDILKKHRKGVDVRQIQKAVDVLNELGIQWHGYVMFGGVDMCKKDAIDVAIKTGKFMVDNNAHRISINGLFVTEKMSSRVGNRVYVPTYEDLMQVLTELSEYCEGKDVSPKFRVGFEDEYTEDVEKFPFVDELHGPEIVMERLSLFNRSQDLEDLK